jgi:hypothetical protein
MAGQPWGQPWGPQTTQAHHGDSEATQFLPPQTTQAHHGDSEATQFLPPQTTQAQADSQATQFLPPQTTQAQADSEATQFLPPQTTQAQADSQATQLIAPIAGGGSPLSAVPGGAQAELMPQPPTPPSGAPHGIGVAWPGDRQPPAEFDALFRSDAAPDAPMGATQPMPRFAEPPRQPGGHPQQAPFDPPGRAARRTSDRRRGLSPAALVGIVVAGCAIAGLAAGAALSSGGDEKKTDEGTNPTVMAGSDDTESSPAADPAEQQAKALNGLLADSNNSRATVIKSVESIRSCTNLTQAAQDLRGAAGQRADLVIRLQKISVDKLPGHQSLSSSLTSAWRASAAADNHYAAWADQVATGGRKLCRNGKARATDQTAAGNRESGEATRAKQQAAGLWNTIAAEYGLPKRQYTQL